MSGFEIGKKIKLDGITLDQLTQGAGKKEKERIKSIFDKFNTTKAEEGENEVLDKKEQMSLFAYMKKVAGEDYQITKKEAKGDNNTENFEYKGLKEFAKALTKLFGDNSADIHTERDIYTISDIESSEEMYSLDGKYMGKLASNGNVYDENNRILHEKKGDYIFAHEYSENRHTVTVTDSNLQQVDYTVLDDGKYQDADGKKFEFTENGGFVQINDAPTQGGGATGGVQGGEGAGGTQSGEGTGGIRTDDAHGPVTTDRPQKRSLGKRTLPSQWNKKRVYRNDEAVRALGLESCATAGEVLAKLLSKYAPNAQNLQKDKLLEALIYCNPSVFDPDGNVWANPTWDNLDFPTDVAQLYAEGAELPTVRR